MHLRRGGQESDFGRKDQTKFQEKREGLRAHQANRRRGGRTGIGIPYLPSNLSVIIFQSLIQLTRRFAIGKTIMRNFVEPPFLEIITDFTSVDSIFRGVDSEDFTKKLECSFSVAFEIGEDLTHIEVPLRAEPACVEQEVARNRNPHDGAADINVWKVERLPIECDETLRADLADVRPEVCEQLALIRLAISAGPIQFQPVNADAN